MTIHHSTISCQESMRWVLRHAMSFEAPLKRRYKWYIFADDDVYFRAPALVALLSQYDHSKPVAFTGASGSRG